MIRSTFFCTVYLSLRISNYPIGMSFIDAESLLQVGIPDRFVECFSTQQVIHRLNRSTPKDRCKCFKKHF